MADQPSHISSELSRELSLFQITMMGVGMMIGAGVFLGVGNAIHHSGPGGVLLTFALNGLIAIFTAMAYAELSSAIPKAGGAYNFARIGFGRSTSFVAGWMEWFASSVAGSAYAITFAIYVVRYLVALDIINLPAIQIIIIEKSTAALIACLFIYINYRGASETGKIGAIITLGQTLFLILIGIAGFYIVLKDPTRLQNFKPFMPRGWGKLLVTMGFTYVAFEGYEVIAQAGDEAIDPKKNLPKAMIYSVFIVTLTYIGVAFATVVSVKAETLTVDMAVWEWIGSHGERGFGEAIAQLMPFANFLLTLAVIFASTSALNATIYSATRASYALGRDHMLPPAMAKISKKRKTPWVALLGTGTIVIFVAVFLKTMDVASSASIMFLFLFFLVNICVIKIRRNMGDELQYGFMMPLFPILPILAIIFQILLVTHLHSVSRTAIIIGPAWVLIGILIYNVYSKKRALTTEDEIRILEDEKIDIVEKEADYRILVPVANPNNALSLVKTTYKISNVKNAEINLLHMVKVPDQVPLSDAERYMFTGKEAIVEIMLYLAPLFPVNSTIRYCRNIARGIISAVREKRTNMLIMGWHGKMHGQEYSLGSTLDPVIERSPCDIVILKDCGNLCAKRILVPIAGGPNCEFALEMAHILAESDDTEIVAFNVVTGKHDPDLNMLVENTEKSHNIEPGRFEIKIKRHRDVIETILDEAKNYDLVVVGATEQSVFNQFFKSSIPEALAQRCRKPFVMVKAAGGIRSWIKWWV